MKIGRNVKVIVVGYSKRQCANFINSIMGLYDWMKENSRILEDLHVGKIGYQISDCDGNSLKFYSAVAGSKGTKYYIKQLSRIPEDFLDGLPYYGIHRRDFSERVLIVSALGVGDTSAFQRALDLSREKIMPYIMMDERDLEFIYGIIIEGKRYMKKYGLEKPDLKGWPLSKYDAPFSAQLAGDEVKGHAIFNAALSMERDLSSSARESCKKLIGVLLLSSLLIATDVEDS